MRWNFRSMSMVYTAVLAVVLVSSSGCGSGGPKGTVEGKVTFDGKAVEGGTVTFAPVDSGAGRPGVATVRPDGTFTAGTESETDGVAVGKHQLHFTPAVVKWEPPENWNGEGDPQPPKSPYADLVPKEKEVEVKSGKNDIQIELVRKTK